MAFSSQSKDFEPIQYHETQALYRQGLMTTQRALFEAIIEQLGPEPPVCSVCPPIPQGLDSQDGEENPIKGVLKALMAPIHCPCLLDPWRRSVVDMVEETWGAELWVRIARVNEKRDAQSCHQCGVCCRLAHSEYDWQTLQQRALAGDDFAQQFTSVFLPYGSAQEAAEKFPQLVHGVQDFSGADKVYFYHCPYVGDDNRCTLFGSPKRPALCGSYPETPLVFIQPKCAWRPWQEETHTETLLTHGAVELCQTLSQGIRSLYGHLWDETS